MQGKKCLFERFGGDQQVSELIDQFYYKVLFDKLLRDKFLKADMSRVRYQQKRFFSEMMGDKNTHYTGRYSYTYPRDLIEVHKSLNITNQQFDKFKVHLKNIAQDMEVGGADLEELLDNVEKYRDKIVFNKAQHFQWDDPTIRDLIETLYNKILFDQGLRGKFYETDMRRLKCHQKQFIAFLLDLPDVSTCHEKISKIHKHLKITEEQFNRFVTLVQQICQHMDIPEDAITQLTSKLETFKPYLVILQQ